MHQIKGTFTPRADHLHRIVLKQLQACQPPDYHVRFVEKAAEASTNLLHQRISQNRRPREGEQTGAKEEAG